MVYSIFFTVLSFYRRSNTMKRFEVSLAFHFLVWCTRHFTENNLRLEKSERTHKLPSLQGGSSYALHSIVGLDILTKQCNGTVYLMESWSRVLESILGVEPWSELWNGTENFNLGI